jgi:hypothetical protein
MCGGPRSMARRVKVADLGDNLERLRNTAPGGVSATRLDRYRRALAILGSE